MDPGDKGGKVEGVVEWDQMLHHPLFLLPHTAIGLRPLEINLLVDIGRISHTSGVLSSVTKGEEKACQALLLPWAYYKQLFWRSKEIFEDERGKFACILGIFLQMGGF